MGCGTGKGMQSAIVMTPKLSLQEHVVPYEDSIQEPIHEHIYKWKKTAEPQDCSQCHAKSLTFFSCSADGHSLCTKCCPHNYSAKECPNGHRVVWTKKTEGKTCDLCERKSKTFFGCSKCDYSLCAVSCCRPRWTLGKCPNDHALIWRSLASKSICDRCGNDSYEGYVCDVDNFFVCASGCGAQSLCPESDHSRAFGSRQPTSAHSSDICNQSDSQIHPGLLCRGLASRLFQPKGGTPLPRPVLVPIANSQSSLKSSLRSQTSNQLDVSLPAISTKPKPPAQRLAAVEQRSIKEPLHNPRWYPDIRLRPVPRVRFRKVDRELDEVSRLLSRFSAKNANMRLQLADIVNRVQPPHKTPGDGNSSSIFSPHNKFGSHVAQPFRRSKYVARFHDCCRENIPSLYGL